MFSNPRDRLKVNVLRLRCTLNEYDGNDGNVDDDDGNDDDDDDDDADDVYRSLIIHVRFSQII